MAFAETLVELAKQDPWVLCLDGDLATSSRADIFADACPDRFLEMGIAEQNLFGVAAGLSTLGFVPFVSTLACFTKRALDQIRIVIAQPRTNVKFTGAYSGLLTGKTGKTHQAVEDIAIFRAMPNVVTIVPVDGVEVRKAMHAMLARFAGHQHAWDVIREAKAQLDRIRHLGLTRPGRPRATVLEHRAIVERVIAGDAKAAVEAMRAHLGTVMEVLGDMAAKHAEYFDEPGLDEPADRADREAVGQGDLA